jgi:DNA processing protein
VDVPYPPTHAALHQRIAGAGLAISEAPIGSRPTLGAFPKRNRIIAALAQTLFVVEAGERSGALITARIALDLGRNVAAVPGPIDSPRHVGTNRLLSEGAAFVSSLDDVFSIAKLESSRQKSPENPEPMTDQDDDASTILIAVRAGTSDIEDLARSTRLAPRDFAMALALLELRGDLLVGAGGTVEIPGRR